MNNTEFKQWLSDNHACKDAVDWVGDRDLATVWRDCQRGDWMLWLAGKVAGPSGDERRKRLVLTACDCAELARENWRSDAPAKTLATARSWARGKGASLADVRSAADAARAADATADAYAAYVADAAADAYAAYAYAAYAAAATAADAARTVTLAQCADIVRRHYPEAPL